MRQIVQRRDRLEARDTMRVDHAEDVAEGVEHRRSWKKRTLAERVQPKRRRMF
jgi:hypothetical protein